jgi:hypothetical protein
MAILEERRLGVPVQPSIYGVSAIFGRRAFAWGAVFAGAITATALQLLCGLAVDPSAYLVGGQIPVTGVSAFSGVWYVVYTVGAMFVAGMIAGQTGGGAENRLLHGLVTWALATVTGFFGFAIWAGQINIGPMATPLMSDPGMVGMALISRGWMVTGMILGLVAAIYGAARSDFTVINTDVRG